MSTATEEEDVSPTLVKRFNAAAALARDGRNDEALKAYGKILDPLENPSEKRVVTADFSATVGLRKAFCLMDLGKYAEARASFEKDFPDKLLEELPWETLFEFHFAYGNTLGNLKALAPAHQQLKKAVEAAQETDDVQSYQKAWYWALRWTFEAKAWDTLLTQSDECNRFSDEEADYEMELMAKEFRCYALDGLGKKAELADAVASLDQEFEDNEVGAYEDEAWDALTEKLEA